MKNWIGQDIEVGSIVGRGAREGNTSSFKVGRVVKLMPDKLKVTVEWQYEPTTIYDKNNKGSYWDRVALGCLPYSGYVGKGSPSIDSLFLLSEDDLARAARLSDLHKEIKEATANGDEISKTEFDARVADLA